MRSEAAAPEAAEAAGRPAAGPLRRLREAYARADLADAHVALVEPSLFYRALNKAPAAAHALLVFVAGQSCAFVRAMVEAGADAVAIADPSATGEIMGPGTSKSLPGHTSTRWRGRRGRRAGRGAARRRA